MKSMVYNTKFSDYEILHTGFYKGYEFYILSLGTHPTAYVGVEKGHPLFGKDYDNIYIKCHGGLTYAGCLTHVTKSENSKWFIGWDYAHYGDYMGYDALDCNCKQWTTGKIFEEVKNVIEQIIAGNIYENPELLEGMESNYPRVGVDEE